MASPFWPGQWLYAQLPEVTGSEAPMVGPGIAAVLCQDCWCGSRPGSQSLQMLPNLPQNVFFPLNSPSLVPAVCS